MKQIFFILTLLFILSSCFKEDVLSPTISLSGENNFTVIIGDEYIDPGFKAEDNKDGDITYLVKVTDKPNTEFTGIYYTRYNVSDASGNQAKETTRIVFVSHDNVSLSSIYSANSSCNITGANDNYFISIEKDELDKKIFYLKGYNNLSSENRIKTVLANNTGQLLNIPKQTILDTVYYGSGTINNIGTEINIDIIREYNTFKDTCSTVLVRD